MNTANLNVSDMAARRASRKDARRLIPFLILCFVIAFWIASMSGLRRSL
jgi:hypothetical protein